MTGFDAAERPVEISRVVSLAKQLKNDADDAMVTSGAEDDLRASQIVSLLEDRQLYARVMVDVGQALYSAQQAADHLTERGCELVPRPHGHRCSPSVCGRRDDRRCCQVA